MKSGKTDEPLTTDAEVRNARATRMADLILKLLSNDPDPNRDTLAEWLSRCLSAHEADTLALLMDEGMGREALSRATRLSQP